jgi:hypothetical protein
MELPDRAETVSQLHLRHEPMGPPLSEGPLNSLTRLTFRPESYLAAISFRKSTCTVRYGEGTVWLVYCT